MREVSVSSEGGFHFGTMPFRVAEALEDIAAKIKSGDVIVQGCSQEQKNTNEEFQVQVFTVSFTERL